MARSTTGRGCALEARRVREYLFEGHAAVRVELISHLCEYYFRRTDNPDHFNIDPHLAGPAIGQMVQNRELVENRTDPMSSWPAAGPCS